MRVFGLIGEKLSHSLSPEIHEDLYSKISMNAKFNLFLVAKSDVSNIVASLKTLGVVGTNVTIPYKEVVMDQLDFISDEAKKIGAINTIFMKDGKSFGYNTDYYGFKRMLEREDVIFKNNVFYVLGSGGASKAIVHCLLDEGASRVVMVSRDKVSASEKFSGISRMEFLNYDELSEIEKAYGIVNTTPCGMYPNIETTAIDKEIFSKFEIACDIVYNPEKTRFLQEAENDGLKIVKGLYMLVAQAMKAEEIWNNIIIDEKVEEEIFEKLSLRFK
ncbi:MAG: shikimate dehydrogenase [Sarcina sp.]